MGKFTQLLERLFIKITAWMLFFKKEKVYGSKRISLSKLFLISKGFFSDHPIPYDFNVYKYSDYVNDIENVKLAYLNYPYGRLLRNKLVFSNYFRSYFQTPECYCLINRGNVEPANLRSYTNSISSVMDLLSKKKLILKPLLGTHGQGIILIEKSVTDEYKFNKKIMGLGEIEKLLKSLNQYLVSEFIEQGAFARQFFPETTNTIRITTFCDPEKPYSFVPYSFMRFGRPKTIPADNTAIGGLLSLIDINTGQLREAIESDNGKIVSHVNHPDTGVLIKGVTIPRWNMLLDFFKNIGGVIKPFIKVAGWDIVLTDDSFFVIEGNNGPDLLFQGADFPIGKNPEVLNFLKYYKIR